MTGSDAGKKILLVDDNETFRLSLGEVLRLNGEFATVEAEKGIDGLRLARCERFDAILLDVGLPDINGCELCRLMRRSGVKSPIIMLTAADTDADTILGLNAGANDYVTKPFRTEVLLARLRTHLRQHEDSDDAVFTIGPYSFRPSRKVLVHGETKKRVRLTEMESAILKYLFQRRGEVVGRDTLLSEIWGYSPDVDSHTLETHVYRLRQKMEVEPWNPEILLTRPKGYELAP